MPQAQTSPWSAVLIAVAVGIGVAVVIGRVSLVVEGTIVGMQSVLLIWVHLVETLVPFMHQLVMLWATFVPQQSGVCIRSRSQ